MASSSWTKFSHSSQSPLFMFMFCFTIHACISSDARSIRPFGDVKSLRKCEQPFTSESSASPCRRIIRAEFDSRARSGSEAAASSSLDRVDYKTEQNEESSQVRSENRDMNDHQDITVMDYHPPHRNSPIHNR